MTRTTYYTAATLDGFIADEHDSLDWLFTQDVDTGGPMGYDAFIAGIGAIAMGRTTYDWVRRHLASGGESWGYTVPTWVFTHRPISPATPDDPAGAPAAPPGADVRFVQGDVAPVHAEMAEAARAGGDLGVWVVGGGDLAAQFAHAGLLDELVVTIAPVTLGAGRPLLPRPFDLRLVELARNGSFACARYDVLAAR